MPAHREAERGTALWSTKWNEKDVTAPLADATFTLYAIDMDKAQDSGRVEAAKTFFSDGQTGPDGV